MEISEEKVKSIFVDVIEGKMTREEADRWAFSIVNAIDSRKNIVFVPAESQKKIWNGILYLYGIDMMEEPGIYLHTQEDIKHALQEIFI